MVHCPLLPIYQHPASGLSLVRKAKSGPAISPFPNLRSGTYRAWSLLRVISNGKGLPNVRLLVLGAQTFVVNSVPDFVPAVKNGTDPGLQILRSHYGPGAVNFGSAEKGRDAGGCIEHGVTNKTTQKVQEAPGKACSTFLSSVSVSHNLLASAWKHGARHFLTCAVSSAQQTLEQRIFRLFRSGERSCIEVFCHCCS